MYACAVANQKGGVGKTTTTHNLGTSLAQKKRVLLIDLDAQGNLSDACGVTDASASIYDVLSGAADVRSVAVPLSDNLHLLPASSDLAVAELAFASKLGRENLLKKALLPCVGVYDYILVDCPPSLGLLTVNALTAVDSVLIPVQAEYYALAGLDLIQDTMRSVVENLNPALHTIGIVLTFFDRRKSLNRDVESGLRGKWGDTVFRTVVRDNVALAEAPSNGQSIFDYRKSSFGAADYTALAKEFALRIKKK